MSLKLIVECNKCGSKADWDIKPGQPIVDVKVREAPRHMSFFELTEDNHICFNCAYEITESE